MFKHMPITLFVFSSSHSILRVKLLLEIEWYLKIPINKVRKILLIIEMIIFLLGLNNYIDRVSFFYIFNILHFCIQNTFNC